MQYKALPWLRVCTFGLGAQSANIWIRDWNVRNAIIEVLVLRNPRTCPTPPGTVRHDILIWSKLRLSPAVRLIGDEYNGGFAAAAGDR